MTRSELTAMSVTEQLATMEAIWDSLVHSNPELESPDWHQDVLEHRRQRLDDPAAEYVSMAELRQMLG
jgi:hypothetical protein